MQASKLRVVYLDKQFVTQNQAAIAKVAKYAFAKTCETPATAVPEWLFPALRVDLFAHALTFAQFCCRELAIWMDGPIYVGCI